MSKAWASGSTREWREVIRPFILNRDKYRCQIRIPDVCTTVATDVHHIYGRKVTGDKDMTKLQAACHECNLKIGDPSRGDPPPAPRGWWS